MAFAVSIPTHYAGFSACASGFFGSGGLFCRDCISACAASRAWAGVITHLIHSAKLPKIYPAIKGRRGLVSGANFSNPAAKATIIAPKTKPRMFSVITHPHPGMSSAGFGPPNLIQLQSAPPNSQSHSAQRCGFQSGAAESLPKRKASLNWLGVSVSSPCAFNAAIISG